MDVLRSSQFGPFSADQIREGDYYELSQGHPIECSPAGRDHSGPNVSGAEVLDTDPDVEWSGVDAGFSPEPHTLRAPDVAVGPPVAEGGGWIPGAPTLALEYAGRGQDEKKLQQKITDLFTAGTRYVWVVRLVGPRRVEVYEAEGRVRTLSAGEELHAPGVLRNPVPVEALYDRRAAHRVTLRNLLQRQGYEDLDAVLEKGRLEGEAQGEHRGFAHSVLNFLEARGIAVDGAARDRILACADSDLLARWSRRAAHVATVEALFADQGGD